MRTLYIDRKQAFLDAEAGALVVRLPGERPTNVPLVLVERVIVHGGATLSTRLLAELWERDCGLLVLSGRKLEPTARFLGRPRQNVFLRLAQYELVRDPARRLVLARRFVTAKVQGQRRLLSRLRDRRGRDGPRLRDALRRIDEAVAALEGAADLDALNGLEGAAAAAFFSAYGEFFPPSLGFSGRNRRPPRDPVNVCLSLGYTLVQFEAARQAQIVGLDPMLGALHAPAAGRDSLACDLVEPMRAHVERFVHDLFADGVLRAAHFKKAGEACQLGKEGRRHFYEAWECHAPAIARLLARICRNLVRELGRETALPIEVEP